VCRVCIPLPAVVGGRQQVAVVAGTNPSVRWWCRCRPQNGAQVQVVAGVARGGGGGVCGEEVAGRQQAVVAEPKT